MPLSEKIYVLRKRQGMSQEELADALHVSRQSISNWETGAAKPEIGKLKLLAETLAVSVDFLLDEDADLSDWHDDREQTSDNAQEAASGPANPTASSQPHYPDWLANLPKFLQTGIYRYGWLYGIRLALSGLALTIFGIIARVMMNSFFRETAVPGFGNSVLIAPDNLPPQVMDDIRGQLGSEVPGSSTMYIIPNIALILGIIVIISGLVLAFALKQWGERQQNKK